MALIITDRIQDTTTTTGTGAITLAANPPTGYNTFSYAMVTNDTCPYLIQHRTAAEWECGYATYSATNQLTRTTVTTSSNANTAVSFSAGTKDVALADIADLENIISGGTF